MNKEDFLRGLELRLKGLPEHERRRITYVYEELFRQAEENGKSEKEIMEWLSQPNRRAEWDPLMTQQPTSGQAPPPPPEPQSRNAGPGQPDFSGYAASPQQAYTPPPREQSSYSSYPPPPDYPPYAPYPMPQKDSSLKPMLLSVCLGFFNLIFVLGPFLAICATLFALSISAGVLIASPIFVLMGTKWGLSDVTQQAEIYGSLALFGLGLMLGAAMRSVVPWFLRLTRIYIRANKKFIKGE